MENTLELKGFVCVHDDDVFLEDAKPDKEYYYPRNDSVGELVASHFSKIAKGFDVAPSDWTRGTMQMINGVFCQYYVLDEKKGWEEAKEAHVREMAGALQTENRYSGYSEYTITESWTEIFVGGHDLRSELRSHEGKYVIVRINYRT